MKKSSNISSLINNKGAILYQNAKKIIPGGTQLLSKRPEMFAPDLWPSYYSKSKGYDIWDLEGNIFHDMSIMAVGACILGYSDIDVDDAVKKSINNGVNSTLNCPEEFYLANELLDLHPWFDMVRYARGGGEAMNIAIRIARSHTDKELIFFSGYHGWTDWYLSANISTNDNLDGQLLPGLEPNGVPKSLKNTSFPFNANSIDSLREKIKGKEKKIAAIVIEPARGEDAPKGYLKSLRELANEIDAVLIFDEITSGFRSCVGGIHRKYKIYPDICVMAKSMANGYAMSVILGIEKVMESSQKTFISSTNWTERIGPTAALATIKKYKENKVNLHINKIGKSVKKIWNDASKYHKLDINVSGIDSLANFSFNSSDANKLNTIFTIEMLKRGFLGFRQIKPSFAHDKTVLKKYKSAVFEIFDKISNSIDDIKLETDKHHTGFFKLTKD